MGANITTNSGQLSFANEPISEAKFLERNQSMGGIQALYSFRDGKPWCKWSKAERF